MRGLALDAQHARFVVEVLKRLAEADELAEERVLLQACCGAAPFVTASPARLEVSATPLG